MIEDQREPGAAIGVHEEGIDSDLQRISGDGRLQAFLAAVLEIGAGRKIDLVWREPFHRQRFPPQIVGNRIDGGIWRHIIGICHVSYNIELQKKPRLSRCRARKPQQRQQRCR